MLLQNEANQYSRTEVHIKLNSGTVARIPSSKYKLLALVNYSSKVCMFKIMKLILN